MNEYWVSDDESNEAFWEHEWSTHGTCINTLDPSCYADYTKGMEIPDFFQTVVDLFKTLDTYTVRDNPVYLDSFLALPWSMTDNIVRIRPFRLPASRLPAQRPTPSRPSRQLSLRNLAMMSMLAAVEVP